MNMPTATQALAMMRRGELTAEQLVRQCLANIEASDGHIQAWESIDPEWALQQATEADRRRAELPFPGSLNGIPVGIKDIFDTRELPTCYGTAIHRGRTTTRDSAVVQRLKKAGAIILGKTVTTEYAFLHESRTRHPSHADYGPGGSSSGSAAAVAAGHVPIAIGSQTGGSTIRPASFCGVYGYKPQRGLISRQGCLATAPSLDQVGLFANDPEDLLLLSDALVGYDPEDPGSVDLSKEAIVSRPGPPKLLWFDMPYADRYSEATREGAARILSRLGDQITRRPAPKAFEDYLEAHRQIYRYELKDCLAEDRTDHEALMSRVLREALAAGDRISAHEYAQAKQTQAEAERYFADLFEEYDAILTPAATGEAPRYGEGTGDPVCNTLWTLCGLACISLPVLTGKQGLPIGIQCIAPQSPLNIILEYRDLISA